MEDITKTGVFGTFEPTCKIRFLEEPNPNKEYIAITPEYLKDLIKDQMTMEALEAGGVDNWSWYGDSIGEYLRRLPEGYGSGFYEWVEQVKAADETVEDYIYDMCIEDFARYEVEMM